MEKGDLSCHPPLSVFLQLVVQAAICAHRGDHPWSHDVMADTVNDDRSPAFPVAV